MPQFKKLKPFIATCESEHIFQNIDTSLIDTKIHVGGLGLDFGYPENTKKSKDKSKFKLWKLYFQGKFCNEKNKRGCPNLRKRSMV